MESSHVYLYVYVCVCWSSMHFGKQNNLQYCRPPICQTVIILSATIATKTTIRHTNNNNDLGVGKTIIVWEINSCCAMWSWMNKTLGWTIFSGNVGSKFKSSSNFNEVTGRSKNVNFERFLKAVDWVKLYNFF